MVTEKLLYHKFKIKDELALELGDSSSNYQLEDYIQSNLKNRLRKYQEEALRYLHYSQASDNANISFNHLLFNMATGSGKTMVMAALMLYMYKQYNYQNFIFFVHTDAIIQKTKENFFRVLGS